MRPVIALLAPLLFCASLALRAAKGAEPLTLHVAVPGADSNTGLTPDTALASPTGARDRIRLLRAQGKIDGPVHVVFHEGTYELPEPFVLEPRDSGTAGSPVVYSAADGERVVWSGGSRLAQWAKDGMDGWVCTLPEWTVAGSAPAFRSVWIGAERAVWACEPAPGRFLRIEAIAEGEPRGDWTKGQRAFVYSAADAPTWEHVQPGAEVVTFTRWVDTHLRVASIDRAARTAQFTSPNMFELAQGDLYRIEGAPGLLDTRGEWCALADRRLRLVSEHEPRDVVIPRLATLVRLAGTPESGAFVEHVEFRRMAFSHARWWFEASSAITWPSKEVVGFPQAAAGAPGAIVADGARHVVFDACEISHVEAYGIELARGCTDNTLRRCTIEDLGAGGIKIGETAIREPALATRDNKVEDCTIRDGGRIHHQAVGVWIGQSGGNRLSHNLISDFDYSGISVGWTWGYGPSLAIGNVVEFNEVRNLGCRSGNAEPPLGDMAGIYTLGTQADAASHTVIRNNFFHDIAGRTIAWGIYFDEGSTGIVAENNLVLRTTHGSFHQHYGRDNVVRNNLFLLGREAQLWRTRREPHNSFTLERNIIVRASGVMLSGDWSGGFVSRSNVFWSLDGNVVFPGGKVLADWARDVEDQGSIVADPRVMPDSPTPWKLGQESPALASGFVPFDLSSVGPRR